MTRCTVTGLAIGTATLTVTGLDGEVGKTVTINVAACTSAPAAPTGITFSQTTKIKLTEEITAEATTEVTSGNAKPTKYNWTIPGAYFEIVSGAGTRIIRLKAKAGASSITGTITVTATNACGTSAAQSNASAVTVRDAGAGPTVTGSRGTYRTYCYPNGVGCWTIDNSKEGTYNKTTYEGQSAGARGYYYSWANATLKSGSQYTACPTGYSIPTEAQCTVLKDYINGSATSDEKAHWTSGIALAGNYAVSIDHWFNWGIGGVWWSSTSGRCSTPIQAVCMGRTRTSVITIGVFGVSRIDDSLNFDSLIFK